MPSRSLHFEPDIRDHLDANSATVMHLLYVANCCGEGGHPGERIHHYELLNLDPLIGERPIQELCRVFNRNKILPGTGAEREIDAPVRLEELVCSGKRMR